MTQKRRNEITGLRGLSACAIAYIFHYTELFHTMPERFPIQAAVMGFLARYGVCMSEIFFYAQWSAFVLVLSETSVRGRIAAG